MPITLFDLIDKAAEAEGSQRALAAAMNKKPPRISEWKSGEAKPDAHEIAFLARKAGLPVLETVAEIEAQLDSRYAEIWREALEKLKAAGIAASVAILIAINPAPADAKPAPAAQNSVGSLCIMSTIVRTDAKTRPGNVQRLCHRITALPATLPRRASLISISHRALAIWSMRLLFQDRWAYARSSTWRNRR